MPRNIFIQSNGPLTSKVIFEDNARVAYAYLLIDGQIQGDVWIYNHGAAPVHPEWNYPESSAPIRNPIEFAHNSDAPVFSESDVEIRWQTPENRAIEAAIFIKGELWAILKAGEKPGRSKFARKDGPLARVH